MTRLTLHSLLALLLLASGTVGCGGDSGTAAADPDACTGRGCSDIDVRRDTGVDPAGDDTTPAGDDTGASDTGACEPGAPVCVSNTVSGICLTDGTVREIPCSTGQVCRDGDCVVDDPGSCSPTEAATCASGSALRRCLSDGTGYETIPCPAETPFCLAGECGAQLCEPGGRSCDGRNVVQCNDAGTARDTVESCEGTCSDGNCVAADPCTFVAKEYLGCDFWAVYLDNEARGLGFAITVSNPGSSRVNIRVTDGNGNELYEGTVPARDLTLVDLAASTQLDGTSLSRSAFRVQADGPVTVHQFNPPNNLVEGYSNDASLLLPSNALGTEYRVMAYYSGDDMAVFARLSARWYVTIVAANSGSTEVTVETPTGIRAGTGVSAMAPGATQTFTLEQGQVLNLMADRNNGDDPDADDPADMTGMRITSTQPVAVFSGSEASYIPDDTGAADHIEQQLYPVDTWGNEYVLTKFARRGTEDDVYRVMTATGGATLHTTPPIDGVDGHVLRNAGDALEFLYDGDFIVSSDTPLSVGQFMVGSFYPGLSHSCSRTVTSGCAIPVSDACPVGDGTFKRIGDPAFLLPSASSQFRGNYTFLVPEGYLQNWISIAVPTGATVTLDDVAPTEARSAIAGAGWEVLRVPVSPGTHTLVASDRVGLSVYGYGCDVSYAYPGGLDLSSR